MIKTEVAFFGGIKTEVAFFGGPAALRPKKLLSFWSCKQTKIRNKTKNFCL